MDKTRQEIAKEVAVHPYFKEQDVNPYWTNLAESYAKQWSGDFSWMKDVAGQVVSGKLLSAKQVKGILNVARKEGEALAMENLEAQVEPFTDFSIEFAVSQETPETPENAELTAITEKLVEIQKRMQTITEITGPLEQAIKNFEAKEHEIFLEAEKQIQVVRSEKSLVQQEFSKINSELAALATELENQKRLRALTLQQIAAQELFETTKKQFEELRKGKPWEHSIRDYQWDDVTFTVAAFLAGKGGVLNANDMGLGKTAETDFVLDMIEPMFAEKFNRLPHILWLTKKTLRHSTFDELREWTPNRKIVVLDGNETAREFQLELAYASNLMVIANYDMMNTTSILHYDWDIVVMDEVHKLKGGANSTPTKIFENAKALLHDKVTGKPKENVFFIPLSGSPIQNHPKEMWTYLHLFDPDRFPNVRHFDRNFLFGWGQTDEDGNPIVQVDWEKIIRAMKDRVIRHSKDEVLDDLPDKIRVFHSVERGPNQDKAYHQVRDEFFADLGENKDIRYNFSSILAKLIRLRQVNLWPPSVKIKDENGFEHVLEVHESGKLDETMDLIEQLTGAGEQVVVFSAQFNPPLFELERRLSEQKISSALLLGENSHRFREIEKAFQQGEVQVLLVNRMTGGEGLNLQKSDRWPGGSNNAIFLDLWWNPESNKQAEDRLHRIGQKDAVMINVLQDENSVDMFIAGKLEMKEAMIQGIMERDELRKGSEWIELLKDLI